MFSKLDSGSVKYLISFMKNYEVAMTNQSSSAGAL